MRFLFINRTTLPSLIRQLFSLAREKKPSIIFIDEIDALCGSRDSGNSDGTNEDTARMKTELLVQMDGVGNDNSGVLLLAATNLPWILDPAVRRRFQKRIHLPLPDEKARNQLFKIHAGDLARALNEHDFLELARRTDGLSGSDIANAVQDALMVPIKTVHSARHFKKVSMACQIRHRDGRHELILTIDSVGGLGVVYTMRRPRTWGDDYDMEGCSPETAKRTGTGRVGLLQSPTKNEALRRSPRDQQVSRMVSAVRSGRGLEYSKWLYSLPYSSSSPSCRLALAATTEEGIDFGRRLRVRLRDSPKLRFSWELLRHIQNGQDLLLQAPERHI